MPTESHDRSHPGDRRWCAEAVHRLEGEVSRSADTHLLVFPLPPEWGIHLYMKDESAHPTGSLKHRLARSLFLYAIANGWLHEGTTVVEASSGSTAVSEAYFANLLGLPYLAVMPAGTSPEKIDLIESFGGRCHLVDDGATILTEARRVAAACGGHYLDQFTFAERATDWRGNNNIAESIFTQLRQEPHPIPEWIVVGAGTGGTAATIGRYLRYRCHDTRLLVVDPEDSAYYGSWVAGDRHVTTDRPSRIEGIGRPQVEPSFEPAVIDRMHRVPDAASLAAARVLRSRTGIHAGGSTGTNLWGALHLAAEMLAAGRTGSIVTLICDGGERYAHTYGDDAWLAAQQLDPAPYAEAIETLLTTGEWRHP